MAYYGDESGDTLTLPTVDPPTWHERSVQDRFRLGRELARDFEDASFSSVPPPGAADQTDSMDIARDANATSTKRIQPHVPMRLPAGAPPGTMLYHSPTIDSKLMHDHFIDFTMAADHNDNTDSYEIGRTRPAGAGVSFVDPENDVFSFGGPGSSPRKNEGRKSNAGRPDDGSSQDGGDGRRRISDRKQRVPIVDRSLGSPAPTRKSSPPTLNFEPHAATPKRGKRLSSSSGERPSKIADYVSNSGSGGSRASRFVNPPTTHRDSEEEALSDIGAGREWRFQRMSTMPSSPPPRRTDGLDQDQTQKGASGVIPKSFKSTGDFLKELGLDGHTRTLNLQTTLRALKDPAPVARPRTKQSSRAQTTRQRIVEPSFMIPNMPDVTDLFAGNDVTRFSAKNGAAAESHVPIDSIPIPQDTRAMLTAMRLLQEKVAALEDSKAANEHQVAKLERELRRAESKYQQEIRRARLAEEEMRRLRRPDSALGGSQDDHAEAERTRVDLMMNKLTLESTIANLRSELEDIKQELQTAKIALRNMQADRNEHVHAVAMAIAANEDLKAINRDLQGQLEQMEQEMRQVEKRTSRQREEHRTREDRHKQKAREARHAAAIAEQDNRRDSEAQEALRQKEQEEQEREDMERVVREQLEEEQEEQRRANNRLDFARDVDEYLKRLRPDLYKDRSEPIFVPPTPEPRTTTVQIEGKKRVIAMPRSQKSRRPLPGDTSELAVLPEPKGKETIAQLQTGRRTPRPVEREITIAGPSGDAFDDTTMSITPEEVRRIAKEINAERKKRKAAQAAEKAKHKEEERQREQIQQAELARQQTTTRDELPAVQPVSAVVSSPTKKKSRKILKVVYLTDGDTTEIHNLERELDGLNVNDFAGATAQQTEVKGLEPVTEPVIAPLQEPVVEQSKAEVPTQSNAAPIVEEVVEAAAPVFEPKPATAVPRVSFEEPTQPSLPIHMHPIVDHAGENHDPRECTVCVRYDDLRRREEEMARENPLKDIDHSCLFPAPELEPVSKRQAAGYEEDPTLRPSVNPQTQLERVVRQLKDEFRHLKLIYQRRNEEFMELDPAIQKKRRKAVTRELNELVAEMDAKSDQIYALYDVNEEFVGREKERENYLGEETEDLIRSLTV
ncbi:hypothetical protein FN846DRAFT_904876 [Sphaerosporella brunnea]|uniref:Cep57 centrosome microtubule-binding domain-containing protein n=1 Tax=Sphaerosporella brunnea TaxID=1250544 RepID=A0A5J5F305_9PEZI|nr:hypothetical protein FN846DRAFT_904876 [Sphaerosporella brunnea]